MRRMSSSVVALVAVLCCAVVSVSAHGWVSSPSSRQDQCFHRTVTNCGNVQYEPQSVEAPKGQMSCSGNVPIWAQLSDDSKPWIVQKLGSGINKFTWTQTAIHVAANWEYYIGTTKIATFLGTANTVHCVDLSGWSGRQKILAVWNVGDTANAFYSCIDVDIGAGVGEGPSCVGGGANVFTPVTNTGCTSTTTQTTYIVAAGDTLASIASARGLTLAALLAVNPTRTATSRVEVGTSVIIPPTTTIFCPTSPNPSSTGMFRRSSSTGGSAVTRVSSSTGAARGRVSSSTGSAGSGGTATSGTCLTTTPTTYTAKTGESLVSIALANSITLDDILRANPGLLSQGQVLSLPFTTCGSSTAGPRTSRNNVTDIESSTGRGFTLDDSAAHAAAGASSVLLASIVAATAALLALR